MVYEFLLVKYNDISAKIVKRRTYKLNATLELAH